jgi:hypothetical protein
MIKKLAVLLVVLALAVSLFSSAWAVAIGASPATLSFELPKGGSEEKTFQISTNAAGSLNFDVAVSSEISKFVTVSSLSGVTILNHPAELTAKVSIPRGTEPGTYDGMISAQSKNPPGLSEGTGSVVATGVAVSVIITVTSESAPWFNFGSKSASTGAATANAEAGIGAGTLLLVIIVIIAIIGAAWFAFRKR